MQGITYYGYCFIFNNLRFYSHKSCVPFALAILDMPSYSHSLLLIIVTFQCDDVLVFINYLPFFKNLCCIIIMDFSREIATTFKYTLNY